MKNLFLLILLLLTLVCSCRDNDIEEIMENRVQPVNLYVAGAEDNQACYWKNGQKVILQNGTGLYATQIVAENNNVYVYGSMISEFGGAGSPTHHYLWINNVRHNLDEYLEDVPDPIPGNDFSIDSKMIVKNGNVYFSGSVTLPNISSTGFTKTNYYWKNGVKNVIINNNTSMAVTAFNIFNDNFYGGIRKNNSSNTPPTWETGFIKNSLYSPLTNDSVILDFYQDNNGIFAFIRNIITNESYLKNVETNAIIQFPANAPSDIVQVITDGDDKYYVGNNFYYKNNNLIYFNDPNS